MTNSPFHTPETDEMSKRLIQQRIDLNAERVASIKAKLLKLSKIIDDAEQDTSWASIGDLGYIEDLLSEILR